MSLVGALAAEAAYSILENDTIRITALVGHWVVVHQATSGSATYAVLRGETSIAALAGRWVVVQTATSGF